MNRYKTAFTFYGSKSKIAHLYPEPTEALIIEPFAGAATYSLRYHTKNVHINEKDSRTFYIWDFLINNPDALDWVKQIPDHVEKGTIVDDLLPKDAPEGLLWLYRSEANQGTLGAKGTHRQATSMCVKRWAVLKSRTLFWLPRIKHWTISNYDAFDLPNCHATWFIDPPYNNAAGNRYLHTGIDYAKLAEFCKSRSGQVIVCENMGANWLPFKELTRKRLGVHSRYQKANIGEAIWTNAQNN